MERRFSWDRVTPSNWRFSFLEIKHELSWNYQMQPQQFWISLNIVSTKAFLAARSVRNVSARAYQMKSLQWPQKTGCLKKRLMNPCSFTQRMVRRLMRSTVGRSFDTLNFLSPRAAFQFSINGSINFPEIVSLQSTTCLLLLRPGGSESGSDINKRRT